MHWPARSSMVQQLTILATGTLLGLLLISTQIGGTDARSVASDDGYFASPISKRNTWWSKKSLDALNTVANDRDQQSNTCEKTLDSYMCYVDRCVPSFVACARQAGSEDLFTACSVLHKICASTCLPPDQGDADVTL